MAGITDVDSAHPIVIRVANDQNGQVVIDGPTLGAAVLGEGDSANRPFQSCRLPCFDGFDCRFHDVVEQFS